MDISILFSGGKDSGLSTILLEPFFSRIELVTFSFGTDDSWKVAADAARILGHPHKKMVFDGETMEKAIEMLRKDGFPNEALNYVHRCAVETLAESCEFVADGTRRDDRAPVMNNSAIRSLEDRRNMHYIRPLAGWGWKTINEVATKHLDFKVELSEKYPASDFEVGLRYAIRERFGQSEVDRIFPAKHTHSRVIRRIKG
jgi:predicted subunit of tRNA(5-methylaminomethyl-2-thiouridylate) methyltransferase